MIHWSEWISSNGRVKLACSDETAILLLTADGQSGIDSEERGFVFELGRVDCDDCKAIISARLEGR